jgi:hypothetical protein
MTTNLSKLTKGVGEFTNEEKRLEIILDDNVKKLLQKFRIQIKKLINHLRINYKAKVLMDNQIVIKLY